MLDCAANENGAELVFTTRNPDGLPEALRTAAMELASTYLTAALALPPVCGEREAWGRLASAPSEVEASVEVGTGAVDACG